MWFKFFNSFYTDLIADIGAIVCALQQVGVEAVGYHGEMDAPSRQEYYLKWKSGQVQTIVATMAFGIGIDKPDIRHVVRSGVPEKYSFLGTGTWLAELAMMTSATILYRRSDIHMQMPGFLTICPIKRGAGIFCPIFQNPGDLLM